MFSAHSITGSRTQYKRLDNHEQDTVPDPLKKNIKVGELQINDPNRLEVGFVVVDRKHVGNTASTVDINVDGCPVRGLLVERQLPPISERKAQVEKASTPTTTDENCTAGFGSNTVVLVSISSRKRLPINQTNRKLAKRESFSSLFLQIGGVSPRYSVLSPRFSTRCEFPYHGNCTNYERMKIVMLPYSRSRSQFSSLLCTA